MFLTNICDDFWKEIWLVLIGAGVSLFVTFSAWFVRWLTSRLTKLETYVQVIEVTDYSLVLKFRFVNKSDESKFVNQINCYIDKGINKLINCENQEIDCGAVIVKETPEGCETSYSMFIPPKSCEEHILRFNSAKKIEKDNTYNIWLGKKKLYPININKIGWRFLKKGVK